MTVGCWIRWVAVLINPPSFAITMIGQIVAAASAPLALNIMSMVSESTVKFISVTPGEENFGPL